MMTPYEHLLVVKQAYDKATDKVCKTYNLKHREFDILMYLVQHPDQATATDLVKKMDISKSHVSISLRSLEERGYVSGEFRGNNRRTIYLCLNDAANEVVEAGRKAQYAFADALVDGFNPDEVKNLVDYLSRLKKNVMAYAKKSNL